MKNYHRSIDPNEAASFSPHDVESARKFLKPYRALQYCVNQDLDKIPDSVLALIYGSGFPSYCSESGQKPIIKSWSEVLPLDAWRFFRDHPTRQGHENSYTRFRPNWRDSSEFDGRKLSTLDGVKEVQELPVKISSSGSQGQLF